MTVHPHAATFDRAADDYERGRPGYPDELRAWIESQFPLNTSSNVLDLGAGTGKFTRLLCATPARVVAAEPVSEMRRVLHDLLPDIEVVDTAAAAMPFDDGAFDLVTCGQSFRWFATEEALSEIARVLVPGGVCLLVFNRDARSDATVAHFQSMLRAVDEETDERKPGMHWRDVVGATERFVVEEQAEFENPFFVDREEFEARLRSSSQFARLGAERQRELIEGFEAKVDHWPLDLLQITSVTALRKSRAGGSAR